MVFRRRRRAKSLGFRKRRRSVSRFRRKRVRKMRPESKIINVQYTNLAVTTTAQISELTNVAQGLTISDRIGRKIQFKSISTRLQLLTGTGGGSPAMRMILFRWNDDTTPVTLNVLLTNNHYSVIGTTQSNKVRVIMDRMISLDSRNKSRWFQKTFRRINWTSRYKDAAGTSGIWGRLFLLLLSQEPAGTTAPLFSGFVRIRYTDT